MTELTYLKYGSLAALTLQNTAAILLMRASRTADGDMYISSTAVVMGEIVKLCVCFLVLGNEYKWSINDTLKHVHDEIIGKPMESLKMGVPSLLYVLQGNLLYIGISNLDAATFQVSYQLKILTTAILSVIMLNRHLTWMKWSALIILMLGVALVQIPDDINSTEHKEGPVDANLNPLAGLTAVVIACSFSGFAGVYFEKILKGTSSSIWIRNIQLGGFGLIIGSVIVYLNDRTAVLEKGFFVGYTNLVWTVILLHAAGGLIIAVVVKYADSILKGFATASAIILSALVSLVLFDFNPSRNFCIGATMVIAAVGMYSRPDAEVTTRPGILPIAMQPIKLETHDDDE
eukprot:CFRG6718T1